MANELRCGEINEPTRDPQVDATADRDTPTGWRLLRLNDTGRVIPIDRLLVDMQARFLKLSRGCIRLRAYHLREHDTGQAS